MPKTILTADAGSTKTTWLLTLNDSTSFYTTTRGINPLLIPEEEVLQLIHEQLHCHEVFQKVDEIRFFGAGCRGKGMEEMKMVIHQAWPMAQQVTVGSDIVGAANALFGTDGSGIACILGTGSNSCLYLRGKITDNVPPLGYILGDEGSGTVLGRRLLGDILKKQMPPEIVQKFYSEYQLTTDEIIERTYRQPLANRFLASFAPFVVRERTQYPEIKQMVKEEFARFFQRNVNVYQRTDLPVGFVGGIAWTLQEELREVASSLGYTLSHILREPLQTEEAVRLDSLHINN